MATYQNDADNADFLIALGSPTLAAGDVVNINQYGTSFTGSIALGVDLASLVLGPSWTGSISASTLTLTCDRTSTGVVEIRFGGTVLQIGSTVKTNVHNEVIVKPARNGRVIYSTCTINKLRLFGGDLTLNTDCDANDIVMLSGTLTMKGGGSPETVNTMVQTGGTCYVARIITTATVSGDANMTLDNSAGSIGTLDFSGVNLTIMQGNITTKLTMREGMLDLSKAKRAITFTDYEIHEGVVVILPPTKIMADPFTNAAKFVGAGPRKLPASGT
jgi:hypothetical protein